jgi:fumarylpyruvate hydrolase
MTAEQLDEYVLPPAPRTGVRVKGTARLFPVRRIYCVGRNYAEHTREMGANPARDQPFYFMKPADAVRASGAVIAYPPHTTNLHHEVELVVAIARGGADIPATRALEYVFGYGVGIDLTRRDLQGVAKKSGQPWDTSKGFDGSAPVSDLCQASEIPPPADNDILLSVNGALRQQGCTRDMILSVADIISDLSTFFELRPGDLIFTGTPSGVGPLRPGDEVIAEIEGVARLSVRIGAPAYIAPT